METTIPLPVKNIYQRLVEVKRLVGGHLKKENQSTQYSYVSSAQVLMKVQGALNKQGLMVMPNIKSCLFVDREVAGKTGTRLERITTMELEYTVINSDNPQEKIVINWFAEGIDSGEKGVGKALTYGEKYFYLKLLGIATDSKDDPDATQEPRQSQQKKNPNPLPVGSLEEPLRVPQTPQAKPEQKPLSKAEELEIKLIKLVSKVKRGKEWLVAKMTSLDLKYEGMEREAFNKLLEEFAGVTGENVDSKIVIHPDQWKCPWMALQKKNYDHNEADVWLKTFYKKFNKESVKELCQSELDETLVEIEKLEAKPLAKLTLEEALKEVSEKKKISLKAKLALRDACSILPEAERPSALELVNAKVLTVDLFIDIANGLIKRQKA